MPCTELALLNIIEGISPKDKSLLPNLAKAKKVLEKHSQRQFSFLSQLEDPGKIYIIGLWDSPEQHWNDFIPSEANKELLRLLEPQLTVEWMFHIDVAHEKILLDAPLLSIGRYFIRDGQKDSYTKTFETAEHHLSTATSPYTIAPGWRMEKEGDGKEEAVLFSGWESVSAHHAFAATPQFEELAKIKDHISGLEIKHAKLIDL